ncbi:penicillin-binding protein 1B [Motilimonas eburnea]|uniref:penicillin-binding protein 1B n=1 Tax=Motilimonas eburnea TaxID=1737488 RepID=UPI001E4B6500|nr:penicillin-binding protein 1B [Motilimonas eburnea]MCE2570981.1 penicillin-binding protein 1B [Motilimonas eburnea]
MATSKKTPSRTTRAKPRRKPSKKARRFTAKKAGAWLFATSLKLSLALVAAVLLYGIYLDSKIRSKLDGPIWQLPAQVFARPLTLYPGMPIEKSEVISELSMLNYRYDPAPRRAGEYAQSKTRIEVVRRAFAFFDGAEPEKRILIEFGDKVVSSITLVETGQKLGYVRLEPLLIDRIGTTNAEDRMMVTLDKMPQLLIDTLLLVEDRDFYQHNGVSPTAIVRAMVTNLKAGQTVQGGSTLTQQLAKNIFLNRNRTLLRKAQEAYMAIIIDFRYSKEQVLEAYLNEVYLGQNGADGIYGFGLASHFYFGRPVAELSVSQIAHLVALVKGPSFYDPWRSPARSLKRRNLVLNMMMEHGLIERHTYDVASALDTGVIKRGALGKQTAPAFLALVRRELEEKVGGLDVIQAGVRVFTSLDPVAQQSAETALVEGLARIEKDRKLKGLEGAIVVSDKRKAELIAVVGGRDVKYAGFNRALDAVRPIGSLVKPAVYVAALEGDYQLASLLKDKPIKLKNKSGKTWTPKNYDKKYRGSVPLHTSLSDSLNIPTVNLGIDVGLDKVVSTLNDMGVDKPIKPYPSLVLGSLSMSPMAVNQIYQTLVSQGLYQPLATVRAVTDAKGQVIYKKAERATRVLDQAASYLTLYNLEEVTKTGTAKSLSWRLPNVALGGKTGTTDELRDSWFVGWDQRDLVSVWVGRDDNQPAGLTGSGGAVPVFAQYMKRRQAKSHQLTMPDGVVMGRFIPSTGALVDKTCSEVIYLPVKKSQLGSQKSCTKNNNKQNKSWLSRIFG